MAFEWKLIPGYDGRYSVSSDGQIMSHARNTVMRNRWGAEVIRPRKETILALTKDKYGYLRVKLAKNGKIKLCQVHRLVAEAFIANEMNKPQVNHINGIKTDNNVNNLEWVTNSENQQHSRRVLKNLVGHKAHNVRLTVEEALKIKELCDAGATNKQISQQFACKGSTVSNIRCGKHWAVRREAA